MSSDGTEDWLRRHIQETESMLERIVLAIEQEREDPRRKVLIDKKAVISKKLLDLEAKMRLQKVRR